MSATNGDASPLIEARLKVRHAGCLAEIVPPSVTLTQLGADRRGGSFLATANDPAALDAAVAALTSSVAAEVIQREGHDAFLRIPAHHACPHVESRTQAAVLWPVSYADGVERVRALFPGNAPLRAYAAHEGVVVESTSVAPLGAVRVSTSLAGLAGGLTRKQFDVLTAAVRGGYYDIPRATTTEALAQRFEISRTTYDEHLRKGEQVLLRQFLSLILDAPGLREAAAKRPGRPRGL